MELTETVKQSSIFKDLKDHEVAEVLRITRERKVHIDEVIMAEGDEGDSMYMLIEGEVEISKALTMKFGDEDYRKTEKVLTRLQAKDSVIFGEMALIGRDKRSASILARTECELLEIKRDDFMRLIENRPELGVKILLNLAQWLVRRLRQSSQDVIRLTTALSIALSK